MTRYRILEASLLASIVLFVSLAVARCAKEQAGTFNEPKLAQCKGVEWTGVARGEITGNGDTPIPPLASGDCARILFSGGEKGTTVTVELQASRDGHQWETLYQIVNPINAEGWGGLADNRQMRIHTSGYVAGTIHYSVFQAKPKQK